MTFCRAQIYTCMTYTCMCIIHTYTDMYNINMHSYITSFHFVILFCLYHFVVRAKLQHQLKAFGARTASSKIRWTGQHS